MKTQKLYSEANAHRPALASPSGFTLLEVLVACGILVFALSGIAAMLPAASSRLADAAAQDRAGFTAVNARTELEARGFRSAQWFTDAGAVRKALAVGQPLEQALDAVSKAPEMPTVPHKTPTGKILEDSIQRYFMKEFWIGSNVRGPFSEEDLEFQLSPSGGVLSLYESMDGLGFPAGPRRFKPGVCWGAMLIPDSLASPATKGMRATLAIAVFRKLPEGRVLALASTSTGGSKTGLYRLPQNETTTQSAFARACSYVLILPPGPPGSTTLPPKWARVNSSWSVRDPNDDKIRHPFVMFSDDPNQIAGYEAGGALTAIGFSSLIRVDEFPVVLE
jgi:type II secretory pathway pseudopilin PulG